MHTSGEELGAYYPEDEAPAAGVQTDRDALLTKLKQFRGRLPADFVLDRQEANSRS